MSEDFAARVADDSDPLRGALRAARGWSGPPPSLFLGVPRVTRYFYNPAGQLVRTETDEWTRADVEMVLALQDYEAGLCAGCGDPRSETTKKENFGRYVGKRAAVCHRCVALAVAADNNHPHKGALSYTAELREPSETPPVPEGTAGRSDPDST